MESLKEVVTGTTKYGGNTCIVRQAALRTPSVLWMWPRPGADGNKWLWNNSETIVSAGDVNYSGAFCVDATRMSFFFVFHNND